LPYKDQIIIELRKKTDQHVTNYNYFDYFDYHDHLDHFDHYNHQDLGKRHVYNNTSFK